MQPLSLDARQVTISSVVVEGRVRRELGDIEALMSSMQSLRLINPVTVTPKRELIAGGRRLEAAMRLGWKNIPCTVVDSLTDATALLMERDENTCRKEMTHSERMDLAHRLEALEKPKAEERRLAGTEAMNSRKRDPLLAPNGADSDRTREKSSHYKVSEAIAPAVGLSQRNYERARAIERAASDDQPTVAQVAKKLTEQLDAGETSLTAAETHLRQTKKEVTKTKENPVPTTTPTPDPEPKGNRKRAAKQVKILGNVASEVGMYIHVLDGLMGEGLDPAITSEEARDIIASLDRFTRATGRIKKSLN